MRGTDTIIGAAGMAITAGVALGAMKMVERMGNSTTRRRVSHSSPRRRSR